MLMETAKVRVIKFNPHAENVYNVLFWKDHVEPSDDSSVGTAEDFRMVKTPKIAWQSMKDTIKDLNKDASALGQKVNTDRLDDVKNEHKIEHLQGDKDAMLKSLKTVTRITTVSHAP